MTHIDPPNVDISLTQDEEADLIIDKLKTPPKRKYSLRSSSVFIYEVDNSFWHPPYE